MPLDSRDRVELYEFRREQIRIGYTNADVAMTWNLVVFEPLPGLSRTRIERTNELERSGVRLTVPYDLPLVQAWLRAPPTPTYQLVIRELPSGLITWIGAVDNVVRKQSFAEIVCTSDAVSQRRLGLRRKWMRNCPHATYSPECGVNRELYRNTGTVISFTGGTVQSAIFGARADGYFAGGELEWEIAAGVYERRFIETHVGNSVTVMGAILELTVGMTIHAFPGDDHTTGPGGCAKFNNEVNYGGVPNLPTRSPFDGEPVY